MQQRENTSRVGKREAREPVKKVEVHRPQETGCPRIDNSPLVESPEAVHNDDHVPTCSTLLSGTAKRIRRCGCRFLIVFLPVLLQKNTFWYSQWSTPATG